MRFSLGFLTAIALGLWLYFGGSSDVTRSLGLPDVREMVDGPESLDSAPEDKSAQEAKPSGPAPTQTKPDIATVMELQAKNLQTLADITSRLERRKAAVEQREAEVRKREVSLATPAVKAAPATKRPKPKKQAQEEAPPPPPPAPLPPPAPSRPPAPPPPAPAVVEAPAAMVYYQCCHCCNCCGCGTYQQIIVQRRVGPLARLFGNR
jgi:hypothetical protein